MSHKQQGPVVVQHKVAIYGSQMQQRQTPFFFNLILYILLAPDAKPGNPAH